MGVAEAPRANFEIAYTPLVQLLHSVLTAKLVFKVLGVHLLDGHVHFNFLFFNWLVVLFGLLLNLKRGRFLFQHGRLSLFQNCAKFFVEFFQLLHEVLSIAF